MMAEYSPGGKIYASIWESVVDAAERFNDPGHFTAFRRYTRLILQIFARTHNPPYEGVLGDICMYEKTSNSGSEAGTKF